ncbi:hypothetical protein COOONC_27669 [Cooperia oncophora]
MPNGEWSRKMHNCAYRSAENSTPCLRLTRNSTLVANVKVRWQGLYLRCEQESLYFTRATNLHVISSKRCPNMGTCKGLKCAAINSSSLIEELNEGNNHPGRTGCLESCGGIGMRFSGCLFYRIFATPRSTKKSTKSSVACAGPEQLKLEIIIENMNSTLGSPRFVISSIPNVPIIIPPLQIVLTSLSLPPTPALAREFITDGIDTSIWSGTLSPSLRCQTWNDAQSLNCTIDDKCTCSGAEATVICECPSDDIETEFHKLPLKIPVKTASWELMRTRNSSLFAKILHMVSSEIIITFNQTIDTALEIVQDEICTVDNAPLQGCYHCTKGAYAIVRCFSKTQTTGEVLCGHHAFVIPCAAQGPESTLRFHLDSARQLLQCSITCGLNSSEFLLTGVLKYVNTLHAPLLSPVEGQNNIYREFQWPDFGHIFDVIFTWYKTLLIALIAVVLALIISYLCLNAIGMRILTFAVRTVWAISCFPMRTLFMLPLPLPEPERLYENIIKLCHNFNSCTTRVTELNNRINALRRSSDSYDNRLHNVELLELSVENLRIEMTFTRFQLRTLFTIPALLCAAGNTTKDIWDAWMDRPHRNDMGLPLLVQPDQIEMVATDQLQQLTHTTNPSWKYAHSHTFTRAGGHSGARPRKEESS